LPWPQIAGLHPARARHEERVIARCVDSPAIFEQELAHYSTAVALESHHPVNDSASLLRA